MTDYRRESVELIAALQEKYGYTLNQIAQKLGKSEVAITRWKNKQSTPSRRNFQALKQLALGNNVDPQNNDDKLDLILKTLQNIDRKLSQTNGMKTETNGTSKVAKFINLLLTLDKE